MSVEIEKEKKFLIKENKLPSLVNKPHIKITQGYLSIDPCVRVRLSSYDENAALTATKTRSSSNVAYLTVKGKGKEERIEIEKKLTLEEGRAMFELCPHVISKRRYYVVGDHVVNPIDYQKNDFFEVDVFAKDLNGLILAEYEFTKSKKFNKPAWLGREVTKDAAFQNPTLAVDGMPDIVIRKIVIESLNIAFKENKYDINAWTVVRIVEDLMDHDSRVENFSPEKVRGHVADWLLKNKILW